jgi:catechol 2,3-dioxygenase
MAPRAIGLNHVAIAYPNREAWLAQLEHLQQAGVEFHVRGEHGMSHSVYISDPDGYGIELLYDLPQQVWEGDLDAALNHFDVLPTEGEGALKDNTDYKVFGS